MHDTKQRSRWIISHKNITTQLWTLPSQTSSAARTSSTKFGKVQKRLPSIRVHYYKYSPSGNEKTTGRYGPRSTCYISCFFFLHMFARRRPDRKHQYSSPCLHSSAKNGHKEKKASKQARQREIVKSSTSTFFITTSPLVSRFPRETGH